MSVSLKEELGCVSDAQIERVLRNILANQVVLTGSDSWDVGSILDGDEAVKEITVTGAALGDFVLVSSSLDVADLALTGAVTAANTVTVQLLNNTGGALDILTPTIYVRVLPKSNHILA